MAKRDNLNLRIKKIRRDLSKIESVKQKVGGDVVEVISDDLFETEVDIPASTGIALSATVEPYDELNHLIKHLWSLEIGQKGKVQLDINYVIPTTTDNKEVASFGNDSLLPHTSPPRTHSVVETSDGALVAFFADGVTSISYYTELYMAVSLDKGSTWTAPVLVTSLLPEPFLGDGNEFDVDIDSNDDIYLAYHNGNSNQSVYYRKLTRATVSTWSVGSAQMVSSNLAMWPSICVLSNDNVIVGYTKTPLLEDYYTYEYSRVVGGGGAPLANNSSNIMFGKIVKYTAGQFMAVFWKNEDKKFYYNINNTGEKFAFDEPDGMLSNWTAVTDSNGDVHMILGKGTLHYVLWNKINWSSKQDLSIGLTDLYNFCLATSGNDLYLYYINNKQVFYKKRTGGSWGSATFFQNMLGYPSFDSIDSLSTSRRFTISDLYYTTIAEDSNGNAIEDFLSIYREVGNIVSDSISLLIENTADDGFEEDDTTWDNTKIKVGEDSGGANSWDMALRLNNVKIPQGATINSVILTLIGNETTSSEVVATTIKGIKEANAGVISSSSRPSQRNKTTANVAWSIPDRGINIEQSSPDLKTIIQEIVDQTSWVSGNSLILVLEDNANTDKKAIFVDYEEQVFDEWYNLIGSVIDLKFWVDLKTSDDVTGKKSFYWVVNNLIADQISVKFKIKGYGIWQSSLSIS